MSDDIVTRLRLRPTILRKNRFGDMETDRAATALFDDCHAIMREAADEIEDLRTQLQGTKGELENALSRERTLLKEQADCRIGADSLEAEIERLRRNTGCARNQRSTQFCAEAVDAQRGFETLQAQLGKNAIALAATFRELRKAEAERDEARRMYCNAMTDHCEEHEARQIAREQGWDCFKEDAR